MQPAFDPRHGQPSASPLDAFLAPQIRTIVEQTYYARINRQAELSRVVTDPGFLANPARHAALYADHGVAHVRDVAQQVLQVLDAAHGTLIPRRTPEQLSWMRGLGVVLAYVHDIGMADTNPHGRAMHAEYAVQAALGPASSLEDVFRHYTGSSLTENERGGLRDVRSTRRTARRLG